MGLLDNTTISIWVSNKESAIIDFHKILLQIEDIPTSFLNKEKIKSRVSFSTEKLLGAAQINVPLSLYRRLLIIRK